MWGVLIVVLNISLTTGNISYILFTSFVNVFWLTLLSHSIPVSYTHLDVYKRQPYMTPSFASSIPLFLPLVLLLIPTSLYLCNVIAAELGLKIVYLFIYFIRYCCPNSRSDVGRHVVIQRFTISLVLVLQSIKPRDGAPRCNITLMD